MGIPLLGVIENVGEMALATVLAISHSSHEDASATLGQARPESQSSELHRPRQRLGRTHSSSWAFSPQTLELAISINLEVLEDCKLGFLSLVLNLLGCGVDFLLPLLGASTEAEDEMKGGLLLDVVVREGAPVL